MSVSPSDFARDLQVRKAFVAAGHTFLVYDFFLTFDDEIRYIWKAPWTVVKVTYLVNRYGNLIGQTVIRLEEFSIIGHGVESFCQKFHLFTSIFMILAAESIHVLVLTRAWAIWGCKRRVAIRLAAGYLLYIVAMISVVIYATKTKIFSTFQAVETSDICTGYTTPYVWLIYVGSFFLDTTMFALTMRSLRKHSRISGRLYPSMLIHLLYRDAIVFFVVSIFTESFTIGAWLSFPTDPRNFLAKAFAVPLLSITGQRLVLNLRGLQVQRYDSRDLSREVDRQLQEMEDADFWNENNPWEPHSLQVASTTEGSGAGSGETAVEDLELKQVQIIQAVKHPSMEVVEIAVEDVV
ncbi:hypothetical protein HYDPIDRAFT_117233 [Hydnomerulius pinastri MD-312]|uniref:DUF6533 domain-containing protein n=1 Tax=Hydnomerulius pinastri MD-312 TaxID=994086 RepID=A0A0C9WA86_9AGAM|nr:hypothetical protein HYDPIDRAFT_117233 [Hydnomerulius pinastri MD-312]